MKIDRLTTAAQEALAGAQTDAVSRGNPEVTGQHILAALLENQTGPGQAILSKAGADANRVRQVVDADLARLPKTSSGAGNTGRDVAEILTKADELAKRMGDSYISSEHLLIALADSSGGAKEILSMLGLSKSRIEDA